MRKSVILAAIAVAMLAAPSVTLAQPPDLSPNLNVQEKGAFTCIEQSLSLVAALIDRQGCAASVGSYTLSGDINELGNGSCTIDDTPVAVATIVDDEFRGTHQQTSIPVAGEIGDADFLDLNGDFWYSGEGEIMYADADFRLCVGDDNECVAPDFPNAKNYDEHVIKDFIRDANQLRRFVLDDGLEVITEDNFPRRKFRQVSRYLPPNGGLGGVVIAKLSIAPADAARCLIQYGALVDDFGEGRQFAGDVTVSQL